MTLPFASLLIRRPSSAKCGSGVASRFRRSPRVFGAALLALATLATACGGGGGGGGGGTPIPPTQPIPPQTAISYTSDGGGTGNSLSLTSSVSGQELTLTLQATSVSNLSGIAFDLVYPRTLLNFSSANELAAFGGASNTSFEVFQESGRLVVGLSRLGATSGFNGNGGFIEFVFTSRTSGTGRVDFENRSGLSSNGTIIGDLDWIGGSVTVN